MSSCMSVYYGRDQNPGRTMFAEAPSTGSTSAVSISLALVYLPSRDGFDRRTRMQISNYSLGPLATVKATVCQIINILPLDI